MLTDTKVTVSLIPHTYRETLLRHKKRRRIVNIETDLLGKYVLNHFKKQEKLAIYETFYGKMDFKKGGILNVSYN